jgi:hypothetical protein
MSQPTWFSFPAALNLLLKGVLISIAFAASAHAQSKRCPSAQVGSNEEHPEQGAQAAEAFVIDWVWKKLDNEPGRIGGSDGPLGCPYGASITVTDTDSGWTGIQQAFQMGRRAHRRDPPRRKRAR